MGFADRIKALFRKPTLDDGVFEDLADLLVEGDLGAAFAFEIVDELKASCKKNKVDSPDAARRLLKELLRPYARKAELVLDNKALNICLLLGVNGVGKTTSCAKLAVWERKQGIENIVL
ncbi:MAG: signal recognition particle receptor subunit alpha, partial [Spirochaetales bacterium]|nr:signal recognition particle receptor subunit alpha [Spirochaetales bacterium]